MADGWIEFFDIETAELMKCCLFSIDLNQLITAVEFFHRFFEDLCADFAYVGLREVDEAAGWFVCEVQLVCYECVIVSCGVHSVVDSQFRCDVIFFIDCLCHLRLFFLVRFRDVFSSRSLYLDGSSLKKLVVLSVSSLGSFLMRSVSSFSLLRKGLYTC